MIRSVTAVIALALATPAAAQSAPFCMVTNSNSFCHYYSMEVCRSALVGLTGQCVANPQRIIEQQQAINPPIAPMVIPPPLQASQAQGGFDMGGFIAAGEAGQRMRIEQERHEAEQALRAAQAKAAMQTPAPVREVVYMCFADSGEVFLTTTPLLGCMVHEIR